MSIESKVNEIISSYPPEGWEERSAAFLHNSTLGEPLERETLYKIAYSHEADFPLDDENNPICSGYCDSETVSAIAAKENENYDPLAPEKRIKLYTLEHRSGYPIGSLTGSKEESYTSSGTYIGIAEDQDLHEVVNPSETNLGYENISIELDPTQHPVYHLIERNKLFGREAAYGFSYRMSTAACLFNGENGNIINYPGYFSEGIGEIPGITTTSTGASSSWSLNLYFVYTPGGGPVSADNWIIKVNEIATRRLQNPSYSLYAIDGSIVLKTYIHFFLPDGAYVRRMIDRSDKVKDETSLNDLNTWYYEDFANATALSETTPLSFVTVWNNCYSGNYKISGKPMNNDFSRFWNLGKPGTISNGTALHPSLPSWNGKEAY